jgi:predicted transcriptional regulator
MQQGQDKYKEKENIIDKVLGALPKDGSPIRAKDLEKKAKMNSRSFYKALSYLELIGAVEKKKVPSKRATGIEYNLFPHYRSVNLNTYIQNQCNDLIKAAFENQQTPQHIMLTKDYMQASYLCDLVSMADEAILKCLKNYADSEDTGRRDRELETCVYLIKHILEKMSNIASVGFSDFSYSITKRARSTRFSDALNISIDKSAKIMGLKENYLPDDIKKLLSGNLVENEMDKPEMKEIEYQKKLRLMEKWSTSQLSDLERDYLKFILKNNLI